MKEELVYSLAKEIYAMIKETPKISRGEINHKTKAEHKPDVMSSVSVIIINMLQLDQIRKKFYVDDNTIRFWISEGSDEKSDPTRVFSSAFCEPPINYLLPYKKREGERTDELIIQILKETQGTKSPSEIGRQLQSSDMVVKLRLSHLWKSGTLMRCGTDYWHPSNSKFVSYIPILFEALKPVFASDPKKGFSLTRVTGQKCKINKEEYDAIISHWISNNIEGKSPPVFS